MKITIKIKTEEDLVEVDRFIIVIKRHIEEMIQDDYTLHDKKPPKFEITATKSYVVE